MAWTPEWEALAKRADAVCFDSLAQRSASSRAAIHKFLAAAKARATLVFDVNLRQHFFFEEVLKKSAKLADVIKVNHEELPRVASTFDSIQFPWGPRPPQSRAASFKRLYRTRAGAPLWFAKT
jgi:fructokinase